MSKASKETSYCNISLDAADIPRRWLVRSLPNHVARKLRIHQWNILSPDLVDGFETVDLNTFTAQHREQLFEHQVSSVAPDILCLQEVNTHGDYLGIQSITRRLSCQLQLASYVPKKHKRDGIAVFYRSQKLRLLSTVAIPLYDEAPESQVACLVTFAYQSESSSSDVVFHVINTHLKAKAENEEIRSRQVDSLLNALRLWNMEKAVVILCGDLNAEPHEVAISKIQSCGFQWVYRQLKISEPLYSSSKKRQGEGDSIRMLDYIFIKSSNQVLVTCEGCLLPPRIEQDALWIPNQDYPSDHWDVVTDLLLINKAQETHQSA